MGLWLPTSNRPVQTSTARAGNCAGRIVWRHRVATRTGLGPAPCPTRAWLRQYGEHVPRTPTFFVVKVGRPQPQTSWPRRRDARASPRDQAATHDVCQQVFRRAARWEQCRFNACLFTPTDPMKRTWVPAFAGMTVWWGSSECGQRSLHPASSFHPCFNRRPPILASKTANACSEEARYAASSSKLCHAPREFGTPLGVTDDNVDRDNPIW